MWKQRQFHNAQCSIDRIGIEFGDLHYVRSCNEIGRDERGAFAESESDSPGSGRPCGPVRPRLWADYGYQRCECECHSFRDGSGAGGV